jgi:molybdopterin converting factor small subunit
MAVRVHIPTPLRQHTQGQAVVEAEGTSVQALLDDLGRRFPGITGRLFDRGQIRRFVNLYLNDEDIRYLDNLTTAVKPGDEVSIIPAVAGGGLL